ncbi:MAG: hypothetical protein LQ343_002319 [Gyalolechia ehrenbergii]|nr:MAG: hypothetical protein LQ343_002319 [Gyalolechia ehrenbergii]
MFTSIPGKRFRAIVIGAGVTGLTLSHALTKAKIEHVVLERGDVAPYQGSSIGIHPHGCRVLDQLGCLDAVEELCVPMKQFVNRLPNGRVLTSSDFFDFIAERNGYDFLNVERRAFLQAIFECFPDKSVIKTHRRVIDIIESEDGIKVVLADGTEEYGDIVVGCDGVNSIVRQAMWANAEKTVPGHITLKEKRTLQTTYSCLLGMAPTPVGLGTRDMTCVHEHGYSFLFLSQPDQIYFFVFSKLPKPIRWPDNQRWTDEDAENVADGVKDHPVSDSLFFGELWRTPVLVSNLSVTMKAVIIKETGTAALADIKEQSMRPDYVRVKTVAVALNPTDFHHTDGAGPVGGILGCDLSGIVEEQQLEDGAFAEYAMIKDGHLAKIPEGMSFEDTASMGAGVTTVGQALYHNLKLPWPEKPTETPFPILVYGGSTATGTLAMQYAKLSGLEVLTTCSPKNFPLAESYGATATFSYQDADCGAQIRAHTQNKLRYVFDCISTESSYAIDAEALSSDPKSTAPQNEQGDKQLHCLALLPPDSFPAERAKEVDVRWMLAYTSFGEEFFKFGATWKVEPEHYEMGVRFWALHGRYLAEGKVRPHPVTVREGGLGGVPEG